MAGTGCVGCASVGRGSVRVTPWLSEHCRGRLAGCKLPRQITVVDEVRRTAVGKSDYRRSRSVFG